MVTGELIDPRQAMEGDIPGQIHYGIQGPPGGFYIPVVTQLDESTIQFTFTPSETNMPALDPVTIELPSSK